VRPRQRITSKVIKSVCGFEARRLVFVQVTACLWKGDSQRSIQFRNTVAIKAAVQSTGRFMGVLLGILVHMMLAHKLLRVDCLSFC
jgi:uncharacterized membrane protein